MTEPLRHHRGIVVPLDRVNVDTDQIIPKQFLKRVERTGFGQFLFYNWRHDDDDQPLDGFILDQPRYQDASVLLARDNFGCGSSREHAPWALLDAGFRVIIAPSFADIFYNNCFKNALLPLRLEASQVDELFTRTYERPGYAVSVDIESCVVSDDQGWQCSFQLDDYRRQCLLDGLDEIGVTLQFETAIQAYEDSHPLQASGTRGA